MVKNKNETPSNWTFLTNHAHVLLSIVDVPDSRMRDLAEKIGITERAVQGIISDLEKERYLTKFRKGRQNVYKIQTRLRLRHSVERHCSILELINLIFGNKEPSKNKK